MFLYVVAMNNWNPKSNTIYNNIKNMNYLEINGTKNVYLYTENFTEKN